MGFRDFVCAFFLVRNVVLRVCADRRGKIDRPRRRPAGSTRRFKDRPALPRFTHRVSYVALSCLIIIRNTIASTIVRAELVNRGRWFFDVRVCDEREDGGSDENATSEFARGQGGVGAPADDARSRAARATKGEGGARGGAADEHRASFARRSKQRASPRPRYRARRRFRRSTTQPASLVRR